MALRFLLSLCLSLITTTPFPTVPVEATDAAAPAQPGAIDSAAADIALTRRTAIVRAVEKVAPSVVGVTTITLEEYQVRYRHPFWEFFYYYPGIVQEKRPSIGSGFIIREDGYILTNHHVVEGAQEITITFADGRSFTVDDIRKDVRVDRRSDLAVIRIDAQDLPVPELGNSDSVIIGEWAVAIGNPFGLLIEDPKPTVTVGVVSAVNRNLRQEQEEGDQIYQNMIQTDASINPGNSGGPLVNSIGQVIGINTFIFTKSGGSLGIGFALPINRAAKVARRLIEGGEQEFWTGFWLHENLTPWLARALGLLTDAGALVTRVEDNSPASRARLNPGDLIIGVNGRRVRSDEDVAEAFRNARVGEVFTLTILRGRRRFDARLVLEAAPANQ